MLVRSGSIGALWRKPWVRSRYFDTSFLESLAERTSCGRGGVGWVKSQYFDVPSCRTIFGTCYARPAVVLRVNEFGTSSALHEHEARLLLGTESARRYAYRQQPRFLAGIELVT